MTELTPPTQPEVKPDVVETMYDLVREIFVAFARQISRSAKVGDQFKMIQQCKELTPETDAQQEVWQLIDLVRQEFHEHERTVSAELAEEEESAP